MIAEIGSRGERRVPRRQMCDRRSHGQDAHHLLFDLLQYPYNLFRNIPRTTPHPSLVFISNANTRYQNRASAGVIRFSAVGGTNVGPTGFPDEESSGSTIPWKISNKYYTADVHFEGITIDQYLSRRKEFDGVPAVLFVWNRGQVRSLLSPFL